MPHQSRLNLYLPPVCNSAYLTGYYRTSLYDGAPWHSPGGYTIPTRPTMAGTPWNRGNYTHL